MTLRQIFSRLQSELYIFINRPCFGRIGDNCRIYSPLKMNGKRNIYIDSNVIIEYKAWLVAVPLNDKSEAKLIIGDGSVLGNFNHIYSTRSIKIGCNVLTADRVYISDNLHSYENISMPVIRQPIKQIGDVEIGDGCWIGEGVCIIGAKIGKNCVIGANAVVTKDIPDYSVAVGIPAKVIRRYDHTIRQWIAVK